MRTLVKSAVTAAALLLSVVISASSASAGGGSIATVVPPIEGYVWGSQPAVASYPSATGYEYNSAGGAVQVNDPRSAPIRSGSSAWPAPGGVAHVSAYGTSSICVVSSWGPSAGDEVVNVRCYTPAGVAADSGSSPT